MSCWMSSTDPLGRRRVSSGSGKVNEDPDQRRWRLMIFVGDDWAEDHHDVYLMNDAGQRLASRRLPEGLAGIRGLHDLIAAHADDHGEGRVGIATDLRLWVAALTGA